LQEGCCKGSVPCFIRRYQLLRIRAVACVDISYYVYQLLRIRAVVRQDMPGRLTQLCASIGLPVGCAAVVASCNLGPQASCIPSDVADGHDSVMVRPRQASCCWSVWCLFDVWFGLSPALWFGPGGFLDIIGWFPHGPRDILLPCFPPYTLYSFCSLRTTSLLGCMVL
jgi:hypothetical protein